MLNGTSSFRFLSCFGLFLLCCSRGLAGSSAEVVLHVRFVSDEGIEGSDLRADEIKIYDAGSELEVLDLTGPGEPFHVGLLLDVSPSTEARIDEIRRSSRRDVADYKLKKTLARATSYLRLVAEAGRSRYYMTTRSGDLTGIYNRISEELRHLYTLRVRSRDDRSPRRLYPLTVATTRPGVRGGVLLTRGTGHPPPAARTTGC